MNGSRKISALISTRRAMEILGVGSTTIKRWANENKLQSVRTAGGHRRFRLADVESLLQQQSGNMPGDLLDANDWISLLTAQTDVAGVRNALLGLHDRLNDWYRVAHFLGGVLEQIGDRWKNNEISVIEEHIATGLLDQALTSIATSIRIPATAPVCLFATLSGEQHTLGLSLARLCVRSSGVQCLWAGADTPVDELIGAIDNIEPAAVALSASAWSTDAGSLIKACHEIATACQEHDTWLILGGAGAWPEDIGDHVHRCHSFEGLRKVMGELGLAQA